MIGSRQMKYGCANVPPIEFNETPDVEGYESIAIVFRDATMDKYGLAKREGCFSDEFLNSRSQEERDLLKQRKEESLERERNIFGSCTTQTISFLKSIGALKKAPVLHNIELWNEFVEMPPFYEGIASAMQSTMIRKLYPHTWSELKKGAVYGSHNLDQLKHTILYVMEYFQKEGLFNDAADVAKGAPVQKWIDERIKYEEEHKEELEAERKANDKERKRREKDHEDFMKALKEDKMDEYFKKKYPDGMKLKKGEKEITLI